MESTFAEWRAGTRVAITVTAKRNPGARDETGLEFGMHGVDSPTS